MISSIEWVPAGVADPSPKKYEFSQAEINLIQMMENHGMEDTDYVQTDSGKDKEKKEQQKKNKKSQSENNNENKNINNDLPADLRMDEYSSDEDDDGAISGAAIGRLLVENSEELATNEVDSPKTNKNLDMDEDDDDGESDYDSDDDDDLADIPDTRDFMPVDIEGLNAIGFSQVGTNSPAYMEDDGSDGDDGSDAEDVLIRSTDAIVVVAKTEEEFATLEVHVYEQDSGNLFVHHDIPLPSFPLCLSHGDISPMGLPGNFCAVGTFTPGIEIWNLDVLNALEPSCILGGEDTSMADEIMRHNMMKNSEKKQQKNVLKPPRDSSLKPGSHTDAIMSLSWNKIHRQVIASGSADCSVKLWDVTQANSDQANASTLKHHKDKVQSVLWHPVEGSLLATGSYDRTVALVDARAIDNVKLVKIPADCESLSWDPFNHHCLTAASEDGTVMCWDVRKFSDKTPLWSIIANEYGGVSDLSYNPHVPGMMATSALDKTVTIWDTYNSSTDKSFGMPPKAKMNKDMKVGKLFTLNFYPSSPWLLGCGGGAKEIAIWDMTRDDTIQKCFSGRLNTSVDESKADASRDETPENETGKILDSIMTSDSHTGKPINDTKKSSSSKKKKKKKAHRAGR